MTRFGLKLMAELRGPRELVDHAVLADGSGFDFVAISDHIHPWLGDHDHSPFAWSVLGAVAHATERVELATGLTCPIGLPPGPRSPSRGRPPPRRASVWPTSSSASGPRDGRSWPSCPTR